MLKAHWKLEWNAHRYWFIAAFSGWMVCLLVGLFYKLGKGALQPVVINLGSDGAIFTAGDDIFLTLLRIIGGSWILIWLLLFVATARGGVYDETRYLFFQTKAPIWKTLINKVIISLVETTILTAGFLFIMLSIITISGADLGVIEALKIILETFLGIWLVNLSFVCIVIVATALSMVPVYGYRFGFIAAIIYFLVINAAQIYIKSNWLPEVGPEIQFHYSLGLAFQFSASEFVFNLLFVVFLLFIATKILNKSADLQ